MAVMTIGLSYKSDSVRCLGIATAAIVLAEMLGDSTQAITVLPFREVEERRASVAGHR